VCAELLDVPDPTRRTHLVERLESSGRILYLDGIHDMRTAARCMRATREAGRTVRSLTACLIAAACIRARLPLLHNDRDFDTLAELTPLRVDHPQ
jgi:predicted nucleic acid-binding protein